MTKRKCSCGDTLPIQHVEERVSAGETMPAGKCPKSGAFTRPEAEPVLAVVKAATYGPRDRSPYRVVFILRTPDGRMYGAPVVNDGGASWTQFGSKREAFAHARGLNLGGVAPDVWRIGGRVGEPYFSAAIIRPVPNADKPEAIPADYAARLRAEHRARMEAGL